MVVDNALANSKVNEERERIKRDREQRREMEQLSELFKMMDDNGVQGLGGGKDKDLQARRRFDVVCRLKD